MNKIFVVLGLLFALILTACGGEVSVPSVAAKDGTAAAAQSSGKLRLNENYSDALPVQSQLAIGTLQLENGDNAVDETLAAELLPLWRAVQSLANSDTAAEAEVTAVLNQIQDTMSPEQVKTIADMQLTDDSVQEMMADGTLIMGRGGFAGNRADSEDDSGFPGGGFPGGGPGSGIPNGGPGGLGGAPGEMQTRMAEGTAGDGLDMSSFQSMAMTGAVIRLLESKTGEVSQDSFGRGGIFAEALTAVSEATGLSEEDVQTAMNSGKTLAEIIEANGGNLEAIKATLLESLADSDFMQNQDPDEFITNFLNGSGFGPPTGNE